MHILLHLGILGRSIPFYLVIFTISFMLVFGVLLNVRSVILMRRRFCSIF